MTNFIAPEQRQQYHQFVNAFRESHHQIFVGKAVEKAITNAKIFKASKRKEQRLAKEDQRRVDVEEKLKKSLGKPQKFITDSSEYVLPVGQIDDDFARLQRLTSMEHILNNNFVHNKYYIGAHLKSLKLLLKDSFFEYLQQKQYSISKPEVYFAIQFHSVIDKKTKFDKFESDGAFFSAKSKNYFLFWCCLLYTSPSPRD